MATKTLAALKQDTIADLKDSCSTAGKLDVEKFVRWSNELAGTITRRAQKKITNDQNDLAAFVNANAASFTTFREAREAERIANGDPEE